MKKFKIVLFQRYIRSFVTNFFKHSKKFGFIMEQKEETNSQLYKKLNDFNKEIKRNKVNSLLKIRRFLGIPNIRFKFSSEGDLLFTYGCLVFGNKPYCIYSETGLSIYNYDRKIADNPIARLITSLLIKRKNLKKIIFLSQAAQKSFLASAKYPKKIQETIKQKSTYCYPLMDSKICSIKKYSGEIKLIFVGTFYMKGGNELLNAFEKIISNYKNVRLTIITSLGVMKKEDIEKIRKISCVELLNAKYNKEQMEKIYEKHDIFIMPTYRDGFGLSWVEALSHAMPIIGTKQFATEEFCIDGYNGFMYPNHPLQDYNPKTFEIYGNFYNPKNFYTALFKYQREGKMKPIENFLYDSIEKFILQSDLMEKFSKNSLKHYNNNFSPDIIVKKFDNILLESLL